MDFTIDWYPDAQIVELQNVVKRVQVSGLYLEIGTWQGKSAIALAQTINPIVLECVDTWQGNEDESVVTGIEHTSVIYARERNIYNAFINNLKTANITNVHIWKMTWQYFMEFYHKNRSIAFVHIDACHDYHSVLQTIEALKPFMVTGSIMCGDDYLTAPDTREDLQGGVMRAVKDSLPQHQHINNLWWYQFP